MLYKLRGIVQTLLFTVATMTGISPCHLTSSEDPLYLVSWCLININYSVSDGAHVRGGIFPTFVSGEVLFSSYDLFMIHSPL